MAKICIGTGNCKSGSTGGCTSGSTGRGLESGTDVIRTVIDGYTFESK